MLRSCLGSGSFRLDLAKVSQLVISYGLLVTWYVELLRILIYLYLLILNYLKNGMGLGAILIFLLKK